MDKRHVSGQNHYGVKDRGNIAELSLFHVCPVVIYGIAAQDSPVD